ncbi:sensor histidine kinase [Rubripirellula reticaptiva]|uniref:Sensor histidine kinase LiaS n=1 Tax=Rubripirellula reticaptiva TaxID=2528013 RepID=A0A5C6EE00_9BACT|nr:PAS domain S-box protein [Rubripirellula reticaptiva]TWU46674.1 Sensor histidine kinase LiaS [Rubripirellula reticaptiva]
MNEPSESLRRRALALLKRSIKDAAEVPIAEMPKLLHELQVHQMELEIQNEQLRQTQLQLAESRDRYSDLYEFAPVGYLTLDRQGVIQQANLTAATMLDVERKHLKGRKFSEFVSNDSQDTWHLHRRTVFAEPLSAACELRMKAVEGVPTSFLVQSLAFFNNQGKLEQCRTTISDESERRIAFDALRKLNINLDDSLSETSSQLDQSIDRLRLLSEAMAHLGEGVMITSNNLEWPGPVIIFVNEAVCRMSGYGPNELIGKSPRILQGEATQSDALQRLRYELKTHGASHVELVNYRKDGTPYDVELFITALFDANGKRTNFVSIQRDITHRKQVAEELRRQHEFNHNIVNTSPYVTLVLDCKGRIVEFNPYLQKITGYSFDEVKGLDWFETFLPDVDCRVIKDLFENALAGKLPNGNVNPILTKDGEMRYIEWYNSQLTDSNGQLIGLLCTGQDVTGRRKLERHVLEIANEERRRVGNDLHDGVGQELTGLSMLADSLVIALSRDSRPELAIANKIKVGLQRTLAQVRALSRGMNPVDIDAEGLMSALSEMCIQLSEVDGIDCSFQCDKPVLLRDNETATQLFRIAQEATTNAIRHAHAAHVRILLERTDQRVVLRIIDDGRGIETSDPPATGMGLRTMAYRARMIQGELDVHPVDVGGTEVVCSV